MNSVMEPSPASLSNPLLRYVLATRPPFLSVTLVGCLLGLACAAGAGARIDALSAVLTCFFALVAHAGVNVLNDYFDARNGTDAQNTERVYPFTGGSRFIQNGILTERATGRFGYLLLLSVIPAGLWLTAHSSAQLLYVGFAGLVVGWAYSAPPLQLVSRGLGEFAIAAAWCLVVVGSDLVQRRVFAPASVLAGICYALLVANVLFINQFPDARADAAAGKRTLVVRLRPGPARAVYTLIVVLSAVGLVLGVATGILPRATLLALLPLLLSAAAARALWLGGGKPAGLGGPIRLTILAAIAYGLVLAGALLWGQG